jgi:hypothetical protein
MFKVSISDNADVDLMEACAWYEMQKTDLSKRFLKEFFHTLNIIKKDPLLYQVRYRRNYRCAKIHTEGVK